MDGFFDSRADTLFTLSAIAIAIFTVSIYLFIFIHPFFPIKMKVKDFTPTPIILAKNIYNGAVSYKLYDINRNTTSQAILYIALIVFSVVIVILASFYSPILGVCLAFFFLPFPLIPLSQLKYITAIEFFERGIVSKHFLGSEKTTFYDEIYSVQYRKLINYGHSSTGCYIIISCESTTINAYISNYEIDKVNNIFKNKNVNIAQ